MINKNDHYAAWALLVRELDDAKDHLEQLTLRMAEAPDFGEEEFHGDLLHVYEHLNRAWNGRNEPGDWSTEQWEAFSAFPEGLRPLGKQPDAVPADWIYLPEGVEPLSLWEGLHDAELLQIVSDRLARTMAFSFAIPHVVKFHPLPDQTRFIFSFEAVSAVRAEEFLHWPQKYIIPKGATREEQTRAVAEYSSKGRSQSVAWTALEKSLRIEEARMDVYHAELVQDSRGVALKMEGYFNGNLYHELYLRAGSLQISDSSGKDYDLAQFLRLGEEYWASH